MIGYLTIVNRTDLKIAAISDKVHNRSVDSSALSSASYDILVPSGTSSLSLAVDKLGNPRGADPGLRRLIGIGGVVDEE